MAEGFLRDQVHMTFNFHAVAGLLCSSVWVGESTNTVITDVFDIAFLENRKLCNFMQLPVIAGSETCNYKIICSPVLEINQITNM